MILALIMDLRKYGHHQIYLYYCYYYYYYCRDPMSSTQIQTVLHDVQVVQTTLY